MRYHVLPRGGGTSRAYGPYAALSRESEGRNTFLMQDEFSDQRLPTDVMEDTSAVQDSQLPARNVSWTKEIHPHHLKPALGPAFSPPLKIFGRLRIEGIKMHKTGMLTAQTAWICTQ